ncbi:MAG: class II aldolase/adducin family protein [Pleurocapsa sp.]
MIDEGYIKYHCHWLETPAVSEAEIVELNQWRDKLYQLGLIGQYDNGIGFGNLSIRDGKSDRFIISGTQTGGIPHLSARHYTKVIDFDYQQNSVTCEGLIKASSETLTHAAVYSNPEISAVVHVHHLQLWQQLMERVPASDRHCAYGTPEMAREIIRLCQQDAVKQQKIIVMTGHEAGILAFGRDLTEAATIILQYF